MASEDTVDPSAELLKRWQDDDDPEALNRLLQIEVGVLKHMIRGRSRSEGATTASDIAQQAVMGFLHAKTAPNFSDPRALRGYLWRSAWRLLVKRFEKTSRAPERVDAADMERSDAAFALIAGLKDVERDERAAAVDLALNLLSRTDRDLIRAVYFEGQDITSAGVAVGLAREAANSRLVRARRLLASRLADWSELIG